MSPDNGTNGNGTKTFHLSKIGTVVATWAQLGLAGWAVFYLGAHVKKMEQLTTAVEKIATKQESQDGRLMLIGERLAVVETKVK